MSYSQSKPTQRFNLRTGALVLEACVSAAMLATLLIVINQIVVRLHQQTARVDQHYVAQQVLENSLEEITTISWDNLSSASIDNLKISGLSRAKLPHAELSGEVQEETEPVPAKRITLRITWQDATDRARPPLTLTTWVYKPAESNP